MKTPRTAFDRHRSLLLWIAFALLSGAATSVARPQTGSIQLKTGRGNEPASPLEISSYSVDLILKPSQHSMRAQTTVQFSAQRRLEAVFFELNPALRITGVIDDVGQILNAERTSSDTLNSAPDTDGIQITPSKPLATGESAAWTFTYSGAFEPGTSRSEATTPDAPIQLAAIGDSVTYLLYAAKWLPTVGYETDRFTATLHVHVPIGERVFGSGATGTPHRDKNGLVVYDFNWPRRGFPATIIAGKFSGPFAAPAAPNVHVYLVDALGKTSSPPQPDGESYAAMAGREYNYFASQFGPLDSDQLNVIELPDGTLPAYSAPQISAIASAYLQGRESSRLLANTIAHQWWGNKVSPATRNDLWIANGMSRYAELEYLESISGKTALSDALLNVSASALAYDTIPMADVARYAEFSPQFEAMTYDKGAMIFRMLQWEIGDTDFEQTLRRTLLRGAGKSISAADVEKIAETASQEDLQSFFTQWLDSTGAPTLQADWTLYRLGNNAGFRTTGEISQNLDLFQMPVDVRVETDGKAVNQRVEVAGRSSQFVIDTPGMPRKITLDPDRWLLRNSTDMQVRVHILRGLQMAGQGDTSTAIQEYRQALALDRISSLASYRLGEAYLATLNYQAADDAFHGALDGDGLPKWTEVWSDLQLGKIFDASGQRARAVGKYREALQTNNNTGGALNLAREYLQHPYQSSAKPSTR